MSTDIIELTGDTTVAVAERETSQAAIEAVNGTLCVNCDESHDWDGGFVCPACGYHPTLKRCIEIEAGAPQFQMDGGPQNLWEAIPRWAWILVGGMAAVVAGSIAIRMQLAGNTRMQAAWSFSQIALAEFVTLVMHVLALLYASSKSDRYSPFDLLMKPISLWKPTLNSLPQHAWRVWVFVWAQTAMICAATIIGGMNYSALFDDWGVEKRSDANLVQAIAEQAKENGDGADSLEESLNNSAKVEDVVKTEEEVVAPIESKTVECLIIGYRQSRAGEATSLLLATKVKGRMKYVGLISTIGIPDEAMQRLAVRMPNISQQKPFVKCRLNAKWLRPRLMCEVAYDDWTSSNQLKKPRFHKLLAEIEVR